jgi:hypothetical protein
MLNTTSRYSLHGSASPSKYVSLVRQLHATFGGRTFTVAEAKAAGIDMAHIGMSKLRDEKVVQIEPLPGQLPRKRAANKHPTHWQLTPQAVTYCEGLHDDL